MSSLVSIIMPSYNTGRFIEDTIRCVLSQTYENWELLIVDDCSKDDTDAVVAGFADPRIRYFKNEVNSGAAVTRNRALREAKGRWIAFLDSDDLWHPEKLQKQISFMEEKGYAFSYTDYSEINEDSTPRNVRITGPKRITKAGMYAYCWLGCLTVMYDVNVVGLVQIEDIKKNNDYAMWLKVCQKADCYLLHEDLASYRKRSGSISNHSYITLIKWHYRLFREAEHMNALESAVCTGVNLVCGVYKKIRLVKAKTQKRRRKMAKKSVFYQIRRKGQILAHHLTNPEFMSRLYFKHLLHQSLDLKDPKTFNEKLQWLKLYHWPEQPKAIQCADKYAVRAYIKELGKEGILNEILFVWDSTDQIRWEELPEQFVLKCNHGCGYNIICPDKSKLDEAQTKKKLRKWLREDFSKFNEEPHYAKIPKKIICEKYLGGDVINYNIYCFNGRAVFFSLAGGLGDGIGEHLTYYNTDGTKAEFRNENYPTGENTLSPLLPQMVEMAEFLAKNFPMVRVDLFDVGGRIILSEMTFTPGGALIPFAPAEADRMLGEKLDISELMQEKAGKV